MIVRGPNSEACLGLDACIFYIICFNIWRFSCRTWDWKEHFGRLNLFLLMVSDEWLSPRIWKLSILEISACWFKQFDKMLRFLSNVQMWHYSTTCSEKPILDQTKWVVGRRMIYRSDVTNQPWTIFDLKTSEPSNSHITSKTKESPVTVYCLSQLDPRVLFETHCITVQSSKVP
jgi:hypothetical protein